MICKRLNMLRDEMQRADISCYIIPTSDFHNSEYVSEYFMVRKFFSGFTGSAGTLVVLPDEAALFTDGRYFIQAEKELTGSPIVLMKQGNPGVPTIAAYVEEKLPTGGNIGFDGRVVSGSDGARYAQIAQKKGGKVLCDLDLADAVWKDRPAMPATAPFILEECYSGESAEKKLSRVRKAMEEKNADVHVLTSLDDIAWILNLRANDVECCPVFLANMVIGKEKAYLFANEQAFDDQVKAYLNARNVELKTYDIFYEFLNDHISQSAEKPDKIKGFDDCKAQPFDDDVLEPEDNIRKLADKERVLADKGRINYRLLQLLEKSTCLINASNPSTRMKAVKNETEIANLRKAHLMDGIAVTEFMYGLKKNAGKVPMTELSLTKDLAACREKNPSYIEPSFETICAYGENGAIIHYTATEDDFAVVRGEGLLMIDSGGHYYEGSTDITRTFVMGEITDAMKRDFTLVLRAMLRLKNLRFLYGCKGEHLDLSVREVLWEKGLDYKHGTGHGVGYLLNVHEGPNGFSRRAVSGADSVLEEGMVTTDEPGLYREGEYGIRIENELLCRKGEKNEFGQFMYFEDLTYVPIDLDGVRKEDMDEKEIALLNAYHESVYEKLSPYFEGEKLKWLKNATRKL